MPNGQPALLELRENVRRDAAEQRWRELTSATGLVSHCIGLGC
ncbi:MAG: hypothetical protein VXZ59_08495 [Cyanobacteriota bacterium]|nr:hypothetical protein [Cyanobacteriota bacterium]